MGNSESTSNQSNLPVPTVQTLNTRPHSEHNHPSQNSSKASLTTQKYNSAQNVQSNSTIPSVYKTPFVNNKSTKENIPERVEYEIGPRSNVKAKITATVNPGNNVHQRLNSEDFDDSMIEENSDVVNKQKLNILDGHHGYGPYGVSKTESVLRPANDNKMQFSWNKSFTTNRTLANSNSQQNFNRNNFQNKPTQRAYQELFNIPLTPIPRPLTAHNMNIQTDRYFEEESSSVRKQTFGKDTATNSDAKEIHIPTRENREYYNDEVRIMETGYSSSRKVDTERDFFAGAGHPHNNEQIVKNLNKNYFVDSQRTQGSTDSYGRGGSQYQYTLGKPVHSGLNKVDEYGETPLNEKSDKKSTPSPQNVDSQDPSPMRIQKKINRPSQGGSRGGFPDVEFSFKPSTLKKDSRANQENLDSHRSLRGSRGSVQKSKSQTHKQNLPPIEILESESSYPDGPVSTGSESSLSNHPNQLHLLQVPHQKKSLKTRPHSSNQRRSARSSHQHSHHTNDSLTYLQPVVYPHSVKYAPAQQHLFPQPQSGLNSMPQTPLMSNVPSMPVLHMMNPSDPSYPYMMNQQPPMYYPPHPNSFAHQLPAYHMPHNYSYYYPAPPQHHPHMNPMPQSMYPQPGQYSNLQPMTNNYGHSFASPPSNYSKVADHRHASYHERMPSRERLGGAGDMTKNYSQYNVQNISNYASQPAESLVRANEDPKQLRQSKSLKSLKGVLNNGPAKKDVRDTKTPEPKSEVSKPVIQTKAQSNKETVNEMGRIGKWKKNEEVNKGLKSLNETTISRINEVSRTRRPANQEESEAGNELNMTEYSLVQKLEAGGRDMFIKGISAISSPVARDEDFLKKEYKGEGVLLFGNKPVTTGKNSGKMEILLDKENDLMTWDIKDFMQNPTPNLPNANNTKTAMFDKIKSRIVKEKFKSTAEGCETPISKKDSVKMCFDFTPNRDNDLKVETNESKSIADYFKQSKGSLANKLEEENKRFSTVSNITTKEFDKEELYQRRKSMMKSSKKNRDTDAISNISQIRDFNNRTPDLSSMGLSQISGFALSPMDTRKTREDFLRVPSAAAGNKINIVPEPSSRRNTSTLNSSLIERLAHGQKPKMTKKEMIALTAKNYQNLPEVKNKRDVQKKKEDKMKELKERQEKVKDLDARLRRGKSTNSKRTTGETKSHFF